MAHFQRMLKYPDPMKTEQETVAALAELIEHVPIARLQNVAREAAIEDRGVDAVFDVDVADRHYRLVCEVKNDGHPRTARLAIDQLKHWSLTRPRAELVFMAPYISEQARQLCVDAGVHYLDLYGNYRLALDNLFIERSVADKPAVERRDLKSLFKPKSARVLRWLLKAPDRPARLKEIAEGARVSLGQVHNVKEGLLDREWASTTADGLVLTDADGLLDAWREAYEAPGQSRRYYTIHHGDALLAKLKALMARDGETPRLAMASYSAANWLAPYGRSETTYLYAWPDILSELEAALSLTQTAKGANVLVTVLDDEGVLLDAVRPAPQIVTTSPVQTYLDLNDSGDRGREAAEFLRHQELQWPRP